MKNSRFHKIPYIIIIVLILYMIIPFHHDANTDDVNRNMKESIHYTEKEVHEAMDIAIENFKDNFSGCTLTDIWYDGKKEADQEIEVAKQYNAEEVIILSSNFDAGFHAADGITKNTRYPNFQWILARDKGGTWEAKDAGY